MSLSQLEEALCRERINPDSYSIDGSVPDECYCLIRDGDSWCVFYSERGLRSSQKCFSAESEACLSLFQLLLRDASRVSAG